MRDRRSLYVTATLATLVILAPLAAPGYALGYDMVFVPRQPLRWDLIVPTDSLPRAVPLDAVVSVATQLIPGWLFQRMVLAAAIFLAVVGAGRLVPAEHRTARLVAGLGYAWTPYLAERLLIGHWGLLLAYAGLPWLVAASIGVRQQRPGALPRLLVAAAPAAITPTGGLLVLASTVVLVAGRKFNRTGWLAIAGVAVLNGPWLAAALVTTADGRSDLTGVAAFAARAQNWSGSTGALLATGGIWNAETTLPSRASAFAPLATGILLTLAVIGFTVLRRRWSSGTATRLLVLAGGGFAVSALGVVPGAAHLLEWTVANVPGGGLFRDGTKFLLPYTLLLVVCAALGAERLADALARRRYRAAAPAVLVTALLLPVIVMPDLAFGGAGRISPVRYPADWHAVAREINERPGPVLSLPMSAYRRYDWNAGRTVLDPLPRFVDAEVVIDDTLVVGSLVVAGENRQAAAVRDLIARGAPVSLTGARWVVVQHRVGPEPGSAVLDGLRLVRSGEHLTLYENPSAARSSPPPPLRSSLVVVAGMLALTVTVLAVVGLRRTATAW
ncbi:hypothetical protein GCM10027290_36610 [Micromonospora sonneratiae]|uniref:Membrane protein YfhO n=1 Tax=Micromonospora sonneratiae TaxID=1184706 RepID=A0ABW3YG14_9ACTN